MLTGPCFALKYFPFTLTTLIRVTLIYYDTTYSVPSMMLSLSSTVHGYLQQPHVHMTLEYYPTFYIHAC
jgi:hypothetical protein